MAKILILLSVTVLLLSGCSLVLLSMVTLLSNSSDEVSDSNLTGTPPLIQISNTKEKQGFWFRLHGSTTPTKDSNSVSNSNLKNDV